MFWIGTLIREYIIGILNLKQTIVCVYVLVAQLCLTLCDPMDCSPPGSFVHGILQARILEWVAISFFINKSLTTVKLISK